MKTVIFFTASNSTTSGELASIALLNALANQSYVVLVMSSLIAQIAPLRAADYCAGTIPAAYSGVPVMNPTTAPVQLATNQAVLTTAVDMTVPVTGLFVTKIRATIVNNVVTGFVCS